MGRALGRAEGTKHSGDQKPGGLHGGGSRAGGLGLSLLTSRKTLEEKPLRPLLQL